MAHEMFLLMNVPSMLNPDRRSSWTWIFTTHTSPVSARLVSSKLYMVTQSCMLSQRWSWMDGLRTSVMSCAHFDPIGLTITWLKLSTDSSSVEKPLFSTIGEGRWTPWHTWMSPIHYKMPAGTVWTKTSSDPLRLAGHASITALSSPAKCYRQHQY